MARTRRLLVVAIGASVTAGAADAQRPVTIGGGTEVASTPNPAERLSMPVPTKFTSKIGFIASDPALGAS